MIRGLSHSLNLGISFLTRNNLKLVCTEDKVALMPVKDGSASRVRLVDGGCNSFVNRWSGKVWRTIEEQKILTQVWRIPCEKININVLTEEAIEVYAQEECSIPTGIGKYIPVQTNHGVTRDILIEISDKTVPGLILPEIVRQTIGIVTSCLVTQTEPGQLLEKRKEDGVLKQILV